MEVFVKQIDGSNNYIGLLGAYSSEAEATEALGTFNGETVNGIMENGQPIQYPMITYFLKVGMYTFIIIGLWFGHGLP